MTAAGAVSSELPELPKLTSEQWRKLSRAEKDRLRALKHERRRLDAGLAGADDNGLAGRVIRSEAVAESTANARNAKPENKLAGSPFFDPFSRKPLEITNYGRGGHCFIVLSGPSLLNLDLRQLNRRGCFVIGVNNSPATVRPNLWVHVDTTRKFHVGIWKDPTIIKSVPIYHLGHHHKMYLTEKIGSGESGKFQRLMLKDGNQAYPDDMPGVIGHYRNARFNPDSWLIEASINWGNSKKNATRGKKQGDVIRSLHVLNVMFCVLKHAWAFGFREVYLLGCDFKMDARKPYAFNEGKGGGGVAENNRCYGKMNVMLAALQVKFLEAGFRVWNCWPGSGLTAFPFLEFGKAIEAATVGAGVPQGKLDCEGWYDLHRNR